MPRLTGNFGEIDGCDIHVLDTGDETPSVRYRASVAKCFPDSAWGPTPEIAVQRLEDRAQHGRAEGDPPRRALLLNGGEALSTSGSAHERG